MSSSPRIPPDPFEDLRARRRPSEDPIEIVDFQLHEPAPFEEWDDVSSGVRTRVLTESLLQWLDSVGVDGAVLYPMEDWDWAAQLTTRFPGRFAAVVRLGAPGAERTA